MLCFEHCSPYSLTETMDCYTPTKVRYEYLHEICVITGYYPTVLNALWAMDFIVSGLELNLNMKCKNRSYK